MGTSYVRDAEIPTEIEVTEGQTVTLEVQHIYSEIPIGTKLAIKTR